MNKIKAFTLIELLLALGIVGTVAALTAPRLMDNINKRTLTTQLKNIVNDVTYLSEEQLLNKSTKIIGDTDFGDPVALMSHFESAQPCDDTKRPCWAESYKKLSDMTAADIEIPKNSESIRLKSGATLYYTYGTTELDWKLKDNWYEKWQDRFNEADFVIKKTMKMLPTFAAIKTPPAGNFEIVSPLEKPDYLLWTGGTFIVDVNGPDSPNIVGRDLFEFTISNTGRLPETSTSLTTLQASCKKGIAASCFNYIMTNNWKMDY